MNRPSPVFAGVMIAAWLAVAGLVALVLFAGPRHAVHAWDPFVWRISGEFGVRWYGLAYLCGIAAGWFLAKRWAERSILPISGQQVGDFILAVGLGMIIGGRVGYVLLYQPDLLGFSSSPPWWGVLRLNEGGMASHGGIAGLAVGSWWWCYRHRVSLAVLGDMVAVTAPIGVVAGRFANFINGELWGHPSTVAWARIFPDSAPYASPFPEGSPAWLAWLQSEVAPRHPSQLYALYLEGLLVLACTMPWYARHRRPGLSIGAAMSVYSIGRFIGDFWREADRGQPGGPSLDGVGTVPPIAGFMSLGQVYSLLTLLIGIGVMVWAWRRGPRPEVYRAAVSG